MEEIQNTNYKLQNTNSGFTLIEVLVVIFVLGIGLVGALSFFNINLNNQFEAKNELIAAGLAQEGADLVRNKIDFEKLKGTSWSAIVSSLRTVPGPGCKYIDYGSLGGTHLCSSGNDSVCFSGGRYQQCPGGTDIGMKRKLDITYNADTSLTVICTVSWNGRTTVSNDVIYNNSY